MSVHPRAWGLATLPYLTNGGERGHPNMMNIYRRRKRRSQDKRKYIGRGGETAAWRRR